MLPDGVAEIGIRGCRVTFLNRTVLPLGFVLINRDGITEPSGLVDKAKRNRRRHSWRRRFGMRASAGLMACAAF
jgi:hypothetical protein